MDGQWNNIESFRRFVPPGEQQSAILGGPPAPTAGVPAGHPVSPLQPPQGAAADAYRGASRGW